MTKTSIASDEEYGDFYIYIIDVLKYSFSMELDSGSISEMSIESHKLQLFIQPAKVEFHNFNTHPFEY